MDLYNTNGDRCEHDSFCIGQSYECTPPKVLFVFSYLLQIFLQTTLKFGNPTKILLRKSFIKYFGFMKDFLCKIFVGFPNFKVVYRKIQTSYKRSMSTFDPNPDQINTLVKKKNQGHISYSFRQPDPICQLAFSLSLGCRAIFWLTFRN